jgi:hypothetical protein
MNAQLRRRLEMAGRVRDFFRAHKTDGVGEGLGLAKLEELITRAEVLDAQQRAGLVVSRSSAKQRRELRHALQSKLLLYLRALGALVETEHGELAVQFQFPPSNSSHQALVTAARGMLEKATAQKDVLLARGMPPALLDDLAATLGRAREDDRGHASGPARSCRCKRRSQRGGGRDQEAGARAGWDGAVPVRR